LQTDDNIYLQGPILSSKKYELIKSAAQIEVIVKAFIKKSHIIFKCGISIILT